jgi:hypothetical protein
MVDCTAAVITEAAFHDTVHRSLANHTSQASQLPHDFLLAGPAILAIRPALVQIAKATRGF